MNERELMVTTLAERLGIDQARAEDALMAAFDAVHVSPVAGGWTPQPRDGLAGVQLAKRVEDAVAKEFDGEPLFPCCIVVQDERSGQIGLAAISLLADDVPRFLLLGRGAAMRGLRGRN